MFLLFIILDFIFILSASLDRLSTGDDLAQLSGDRCLSATVVHEREASEHILAVTRSIVHGTGREREQKKNESVKKRRKKRKERKKKNYLELKKKKGFYRHIK